MEEEPVDDFFIASGKKVEQYLQDRILLLKLQATEKIARLVGLLFLGLIISFLLFFMLLFLSYMAGNYFSAITGSVYLGYAIVTGFYIFLFLIVLLSRKWIKKKVMNKVISYVLGKNGSDE